MEEKSISEKKRERYQKIRATMIKKFGSEEAWKEFMRQNGSKGGKNGNNRPFRNREIAVKAAHASAIVRRKKK